ncbi:MAG: hypothetical protein H6719_32750 [Sandaracinaceae bacterium]|nr:hypothetical protein [Sandaracinaceae bacterium]
MVFEKPGGLEEEREMRARLEEMRPVLQALLGQPDDERRGRRVSVALGDELMEALAKRMAILDKDPDHLIDKTISQVLENVSMGDEERSAALHATFELEVPEPLPEFEPGDVVEADNFEGPLNVLPLPEPKPVPIRVPPDRKEVAVVSHRVLDTTGLPDSGFLECLHSLRRVLLVTLPDDASLADKDLIRWARKTVIGRVVNVKPTPAEPDQLWIASRLLAAVERVMTSTLCLPVDEQTRIEAAKRLREWTRDQLKRLQPWTYAVKPSSTRGSKFAVFKALTEILDAAPPRRSTRLGRRLAAELLCVEISSEKLLLDGEKREWRHAYTEDAEGKKRIGEGLVKRLRATVTQRERDEDKRRRKETSKKAAKTKTAKTKAAKTKAAKTKTAKTKTAKTKTAKTKTAKTKTAKTKTANTKAAKTKAAKTKTAKTKTAKTKAAKTKTANTKAAKTKATRASGTKSRGTSRSQHRKPR